MSTEGWIDKQNIVYTSNGILFMLNKEGNSENATRWMNLEVIMLGEVIQSQKTNILWFLLYVVLLIVKIIKTESVMVDARGWGKGK